MHDAAAADLRTRTDLPAVTDPDAILTCVAGTLRSIGPIGRPIAAQLDRGDIAGALRRCEALRIGWQAEALRHVLRLLSTT